MAEIVYLINHWVFALNFTMVFFGYKDVTSPKVVQHVPPTVNLEHLVTNRPDEAKLENCQFGGTYAGSTPKNTCLRASDDPLWKIP
eukprot:1157370-Pelagomonas_calceolata.AAC.2